MIAIIHIHYLIHTKLETLIAMRLADHWRHSIIQNLSGANSIAHLEYALMILR